MKSEHAEIYYYPKAPFLNSISKTLLDQMKSVVEKKCEFFNSKFKGQLNLYENFIHPKKDTSAITRVYRKVNDQFKIPLITLSNSNPKLKCNINELNDNDSSLNKSYLKINNIFTPLSLKHKSKIYFTNSSTDTKKIIESGSLKNIQILKSIEEYNSDRFYQKIESPDKSDYFDSEIYKLKSKRFKIPISPIPIEKSKIKITNPLESYSTDSQIFANSSSTKNVESLYYSINKKDESTENSNINFNNQTITFNSFNNYLHNISKNDENSSINKMSKTQSKNSLVNVNNDSVHLNNNKIQIVNKNYLLNSYINDSVKKKNNIIRIIKKNK